MYTVTIATNHRGEMVMVSPHVMYNRDMSNACNGARRRTARKTVKRVPPAQLSYLTFGRTRGPKDVLGRVPGSSRCCQTSAKDVDPLRLCGHNSVSLPPCVSLVVPRCGEDGLPRIGPCAIQGVCPPSSAWRTLRRDMHGVQVHGMGNPAEPTVGLHMLLWLAVLDGG